MPLQGGRSVQGKWVKAEALNGRICAKFVYDTLGKCFNDLKLLHSRRNKKLCLEDNHGPHNGPESMGAHAALGIEGFGHHAKSSALNPIEVCWHMLKSKMRNIKGVINDFDELFAIAQQCSEVITMEDVNKEVKKMPIRYRQLRTQRGRAISDWHHTPEKQIT